MSTPLQNSEEYVTSQQTPFSEAGVEFLDEIQRAIFDARPGSVHEPFLHHPDWKEAGLSLLVTRGIVAAHMDSWELPQWSYHLVLLNSGFIVRHPQEDASLMPEQPAGTLLRLDIHEEHTLTHDYRAGWPHNRDELMGTQWDSIEEGWASLCFNIDEQLSMEEAVEEMRKRIVKLQERVGAGIGSQLINADIYTPLQVDGFPSAAPSEWRQTDTGYEAKIDGEWWSVNGTPETGVQDVRFKIKLNLPDL